MSLESSSDVGVTRREAAESLDLTERQIDRLIRDGFLSAIKGVHKVRVTTESLRSEMDRRQPRPIEAKQREAAA